MALRIPRINEDILNEAYLSLTTPLGETISRLSRRLSVSWKILKRDLIELMGRENYSYEVKNRMKEDMFNNTRGMGRIVSQETRKWMSSIHSKENNPNWDGGFATRRANKEFRELRRKVLERDNYACTECGDEETLIVHHIIADEYDFDLLYSEDNCRTLCRSCHIILHKDQEKFDNNS